MKKSIPIVLAAALSSLLVGCTTTPVALAPVKPNSPAPFAMTGDGQLEVFSALVGHSEGNNPAWYQHSDYSIYDQQGRRLEHVDNTIGYYSQAPRLISLPAGKYIVKAPANGALCAEVPVVIAPGQLTKVHLDRGLKLPADSAATEVSQSLH